MSFRLSAASPGRHTFCTSRSLGKLPYPSFSFVWLIAVERDALRNPSQDQIDCDKKIWRMRDVTPSLLINDRIKNSKWIDDYRSILTVEENRRNDPRRLNRNYNGRFAGWLRFKARTTSEAPIKNCWRAFEELQKDANDRGKRGEVGEGWAGRRRIPKRVLAQVRSGSRLRNTSIEHGRGRRDLMFVWCEELPERRLSLLNVNVFVSWTRHCIPRNGSHWRSQRGTSSFCIFSRSLYRILFLLRISRTTPSRTRSPERWILHSTVRIFLFPLKF